MKNKKKPKNGITDPFLIWVRENCLIIIVNGFGLALARLWPVILVMNLYNNNWKKILGLLLFLDLFISGE
jgi:hypothetical protein